LVDQFEKSEYMTNIRITKSFIVSTKLYVILIAELLIRPYFYEVFV